MNNTGVGDKTTQIGPKKGCRFCDKKEINMKSMILKRHMAARKNKKKGFTLIEVIVVIVIIAILAAIAVPSLTRYIGSAEKRAVQATAHNIQVVLQAEKAERYDESFDKGKGGTPAVAGGKTYLEILSENGVVLGKDDEITDITWEDNTLWTFTYKTQEHSIDYNSKGGGFGEVK